MITSKKWLAFVPAMALVVASCSSSSGSGAGTTSAGGGGSVAASASSVASSAASSGSSASSAATTGASTGGTEAVSQTQAGDLTFYMITHSDDGPFWSVVKRGAEQAAKDLGVKLVWKPGNNDPQVMVKDIEAAVAAGASGIAASLPNADALVGPLKAAVAAHVPVITLNSGSKDYQAIGALTHVGQSEDVAGSGAGDRLNAAGAKKVLCAQQEQGNSGLTERCQGLEKSFKGKVVTQFVGLDADTTAQQNTINAALAADPAIDAILGVGPVVTMSALRAAKDLGRKVTIGGFDLTPELLGAIQAGDIAFTVDQQQYLQGYMPILLLYLNVTNQNTLGGGLPILTGPGFVTKDNAAEVIKLSKQGTR